MLDLPISARSAAVARWPSVSARSASIPPTGRPVRSGLARWFRLYQFSSFRSVRSFVACSGSLAVPFVPVRSRSFVRLVSRSVSFRFALLLLRLVQSRSVLVQVSFVSVSVLLSLFCARAFSRAGLFILFPRILYTKRAQRQMNFLSKNMSFLIISVSSLNYPTLEHFSPLHFASNRSSCDPRDPTSPSPSAPCKKKNTHPDAPCPLNCHRRSRPAATIPIEHSEPTEERSDPRRVGGFPQDALPYPPTPPREPKKKHTLTQAVAALATPAPSSLDTPASRKKTFYLPVIRAPRSSHITASRENALLPRRSRPAVTIPVEPTGRAYQGAPAPP